jgi:hypothetical protein
MFESAKRLQEDVSGLLDALRSLGEGRYAVVFDRNGVLAESPAGGQQGEWTLRQLVQRRAAALFRIPGALQAEEALDDAFEDWKDDEFFLAFVNAKVGVLVACPDARQLEAESGKLLSVMVDRLLRWNAGWRVDEKGRGLFGSRPRLDTVVIGRPQD